jgi:uncharacterized protein YjbI with pentapeptide repeats
MSIVAVGTSFGAVLAGAVLGGAVLDGAVLDGAVLDGVVLGATVAVGSIVVGEGAAPESEPQLASDADNSAALARPTNERGSRLLFQEVM